jgi:serine/threonine-protein kinase HipA
MNRAVFVHVELDGAIHRVGTLWTRAQSGRQSATFEYDPEWLGNPGHFALEPALTIGPGPHHTPADTALFGALSDSAPDRWRRQPDSHGRQPSSSGLRFRAESR